MSKVLIVAPMDNGQQGISLSNALNKHSEHESRCLTITQSYLDYETDILCRDYNTPAKMSELRDLVEDMDFFIFVEYVPKELVGALGILKRINNRNTIISTGGTHSRDRGDEYLWRWLRDDFLLAAGYTDWSIVGKIGRMAFTTNILPIEKLPEPHPPRDRVRVCFAPTKTEKGVDEFSRVMNTILKEYDHVEVVPIFRISWRKSIELKSTANITFNQIRYPAYGNSAIESMYFQHAVLSNMDSWTLSLFPDLPIVDVKTERGLYKSLKRLIEDPKEIKKRGRQGKEFVEKWHTPKKVAKTWEHLINFVKNEM